MSLLEVKHQVRAVKTIQQALLVDRLPHAYVFHGPHGVGTEMLALGLAEVLLCSKPIHQPVEAVDQEAVGLDELHLGCGACEDCRAVAAQTHPDLHLIHRHLNRDHPDPVVRKRKALEIGVEVVRHFVIEKVGLTSQRGLGKLFIIREADQITPHAQNAMLKTLEEPPSDSYLFLLTRSADALLPTTRSRWAASD